ncbi:LysM domain/BON superfamily protein [Oceanobacillus oncorhynchi]|uniref:LysM domain/BON superfamily protein n=1 Tax=Oceanobacillus oncorhynchi TaxID=545501 RepID=A0A0A1MD30_9BACI|nr:SGNH/GDSL hydrolase family protein [Oceanobacillus oncorhynchi]CEI80988.1 LysM domain/BON superfamily protein [Oceanobacillus oncorhynchi]
MKNKLLLTFLSTLLIGVILSPRAMKAQPAEGYDPADEMYIKADKDHYWKGRYSNGRVFSEYIANELAGDYDNLINYAVGGAFSGDMASTGEEHSNWSSWLKGWGGVEQTERFLADMHGEADPEALYIISIGGNDTYAVEDLGVEPAAELASDYSLEMVQNLVEGGAKYILLPNRFEDERTNLTDFSDIRNQQVVQKVEDYLALDSTPDDVEVIYGHNQQLRENIDEQGFEEFGYKSMGFYLVSDWVPAYGYALASEDNSDIFPANEAEDTYGGYGHYSIDSEYYNPESAGWEPDDFYTYDEYHLSNRSQKHVATYLLNSDIATDDNDGVFEQVYNGEVSSFAEAIADGKIPSEYTTVYTFGDSSIDTGRGLEVTTELVENRGKPEVSSYTVQSGDNLWNIAKRNYPGEQANAQIAKEVQAIYQANKDQIRNPDLIFPYQTITLPTMNDSKTSK